MTLISPFLCPVLANHYNFLRRGSLAFLKAQKPCKKALFFILLPQQLVKYVFSKCFFT